MDRVPQMGGTVQVPFPNEDGVHVYQVSNCLSHSVPSRSLSYVTMDRKLLVADGMTIESRKW